MVYIFKAINVCYLIYLKTFRTCNKIYKLDLSCFYFTRTSMTSNFKEKRVKPELLTDSDMLLIIEEDIRGGICHAIH